MTLTLPQAPGGYDAIDQQIVRGLVEDAVRDVFRTGVPVELGPDSYIVWTDEDGGRWKVTIDTFGTLNTEAL